MTCATCTSPHHRASECAATSDRTLMYVPMGEADRLRERVAELEQRERDTEASAGRMRGYIAAATGKASDQQSGLEAEVLSLCCAPQGRTKAQHKVRVQRREIRRLNEKLRLFSSLLNPFRAGLAVETAKWDEIGLRNRAMLALREVTGTTRRQEVSTAEVITMAAGMLRAAHLAPAGTCPGNCPGCECKETR